MFQVLKLKRQIHLLKVTRISWSLYTALICVAAPLNRFRHFFLTYSLVYITEPDFPPFLNASSAQKWKKTKFYKSVNRARNTTQWFCRPIKLMMMMMNCFCGMVDRRKALSLISSRDHCQRSSPSRISDKPRAGFEPAQNLSSDLVEWSCAVVITTTPRRHVISVCNYGEDNI